METLPFELLHDTVRRLDCTSLYNVLCASPVISRLFDHDGLQLTRAIFSRDNMCDQIRESIHLVAMLHMVDSFSAKYPSLDAFMNVFINATVKDSRPLRIGESRPIDPPNDLPHNTPIPTIRRVLSTYAQIDNLTIACLEHYLEKCNALRPENMVDPETQYSRDRKTPPWKQRFESFKVPVRHYGPPVWEEERRVCRALWRIHLFYNLRTAAGRLGWPAEDVARLQSMTEDDFYVKWCQTYTYQRDLYEAEEIQTVTEYHYTRAADLVIPHNSCGSSSGGFNRSPQRLRFQRLPFLRHPVKRMWPTTQRADLKPATQMYNIDYETLGVRQWKLLSEPRLSPLRTVTFDFYRRLGLALWCQERVQAIGLAPLNRKSPSINLSLWQFALRSILDPPEVEEVEKRLQTEWEKRERKD